MRALKTILFIICLLILCFVASGADVPATVMAYKDSGRLASPLAFFHTNLVAGSNIVLEPLVDGKLKIHGTNGGGSSFITSIDPFYFEVLAGQLNLTNQNLVDWSQLSTNVILTINPTDGAIPVRASATQFTNSPLSVLDADNVRITKSGGIETFTVGISAGGHGQFIAGTGSDIFWGVNNNGSGDLNLNPLALQPVTSNTLSSGSLLVPWKGIFTDPAGIHFGDGTTQITAATNSTPIASGNTVFTSLIQSTNPPVIKTISAGSNIAITDETTNLAVAVTGTVPAATTSTFVSQSPLTNSVTNLPSVGTAGTYRQVTTDAQGRVSAGLPFETNCILTVSIDGNGSVIGTGAVNGYPVAGDNYTLSGWSITAMGASPTCTIDVWKIASGTALPTVSNSIMGTKPALATGNVIESTTMTGWTNTVTKGDIWGINIDACTVATNIVFQLFGYR